MINSMWTDAAKAVIRRNTEEVQSCGNFDVFEGLSSHRLLMRIGTKVFRNVLPVNRCYNFR